MGNPKSFLFIGSTRRYRVFYHRWTGYWFAAFRDGHRRQRVTLGVRTKLEAEAAIKQLDRPVIIQKHQAVLWCDLQKQYLTYKQELGKAPKTVRRYTSALNAFSRYLKQKSIQYANDITLPALEGYMRYRTETEGCDAKTAYTDALVIKNAFKWASKASRGLLKSNPATDWETPEPVKPKRRTYTADEVVKLEAEVRPWLRAVITTLAWTGMRIDELCNLRWQDVDFKKQVIHVRVQEEWKPKGRKDRMVPMHPKVAAVLRQQRVGEYVFVGPLGGRMKETRCLACLKADQRKLGLPESDLHGFRRYFATTMMQAGVPTETVRQWGGWKSLETMLRYLADVDVKDSVEAMAAAAKKLASA